MKVAHLSDIHVLDLAGTPVTRYFNKRLTGLVNLLGPRKGKHPIAVLEAAVADLVASDVDHVLITGDISNLSLESELRRARDILAPLGGYDRLSVIPGNHDVYTRDAARKRTFDGIFGDLMWGPDASASERTYPWLKDLGDVAVFGFCSAFPTAWLSSYGAVHQDQLDRLAAHAAAATLDGRFVFAMVHHNLHPRGRRKDAMHGFKNRDAFVAACKQAGVGAILHGHTHVAHRFEQDGIRILGCGSSTWSDPDPAHTARYNVYTVEDGALTGIDVHRWDPDTGAFLAGQPLS